MHRLEQRGGSCATQIRLNMVLAILNAAVTDGRKIDGVVAARREYRANEDLLLLAIQALVQTGRQAAQITCVSSVGGLVLSPTTSPTGTKSDFQRHQGQPSRSAPVAAFFLGTRQRG